MRYSLLISVSLLLLSCKKKEIIEPERKSIKIGVVDDSYHYHEYVNPVLLQYTDTDSTINAKIGIDSLDVDLDGIIDFQLKSHDQLDAAVQKSALYFYRLIPVGDFQISYFLKTYYAKYKNFSERYANKFVTGDLLYYEEFHWDSIYTSLWCGHTQAPIPRGPWNTITGVYQIGIRKLVGNSYKYGWITLNIVSSNEIYFVNYALQI